MYALAQAIRDFDKARKELPERYYPLMEANKVIKEARRIIAKQNWKVVFRSGKWVIVQASSSRQAAAVCLKKYPKEKIKYIEIS